MKASELIKQLEDAISKYGDKEVIMEYPVNCTASWDFVEEVGLDDEIDYYSEKSEFIALY